MGKGPFLEQWKNIWICVMRVIVTNINKVVINIIKMSYICRCQGHRHLNASLIIAFKYSSIINDLDSVFGGGIIWPPGQSCIILDL